MLVGGRFQGLYGFFVKWKTCGRRGMGGGVSSLTHVKHGGQDTFQVSFNTDVVQIWLSFCLLVGLSWEKGGIIMKHVL